jgi:hypothetical protein
MGISKKGHGAATENPVVSSTPGEEARLLRAARLVVEVHGSDAASYAVTRAALLRNLGDAMGATAWLRVAPVIEELQRASKLNRRAGASIKGRAPHR